VLRRVLGLLLLLAFPASVFISPTLFKVLAGSLLFAGLGVAASILVLVAGSLVWRRLFPVFFKKSGITIQDRPNLGYVGSEGLGSRLRIEDRWEAICVEWSRTDYAVVILVTGFFGPGIVLLYMLQRKKFNPMPLPVAVGVATLVGLAFYCFVRQVRTYLWARPALRVTSSQIEFLRGGKPVRTILRQQLKSLSVQMHTYHDSDGDPHPNYILTAQSLDGALERLCISHGKQQIEHLMALIGTRMGLPG